MQKPEGKLSRIKVKDINTGSRERTNYGSKEEWQNFKDSIELRQLQPIAVMEYLKPFRDFKYFLLGGGRRLRAVVELKRDEIDAKIFPPGLTAFDIKGIELEENLQRLNLSVEETSKSRRDLFFLWVDQYGRKTSTAKDSDGISIRDAAKKMRVSPTTLSQDIRIANLLDVSEDVRGEVKTRGDAKRLLSQVDKHEKVKTQLEEVRRETPLMDDLTLDRVRKGIIDSYIIGDFLEESGVIKSDSIQLVNFDPDYPREEGREIREGGERVTSGIKIDKALKSYNSVVDFKNFFKSCLDIFYRIMDEESWLIIWFGYEYFSQIQTWVRAAGFDISYLHGKWAKVGSYTGAPRRYLSHSMEPFFYARKGKAQINSPHSDEFRFIKDHHSKAINRFQKPVKLTEEIYKTFISTGSRIVSPCTGSGNDILAALNYECVCLGFDPAEEQKKGFELKVREQQPKYYR